MSKRGFTLVDLLIVIVVIAILASLTFGMTTIVHSTRVQATEMRVHGLGIEVGKVLGTKGAPPATLEDVAKALDQPGWMKAGKFVDIWDQPFEYTVTGKQFKLWSRGADGIPGTADDIRYKRN